MNKHILMKKTVFLLCNFLLKRALLNSLCILHERNNIILIDAMKSPAFDEEIITFTNIYG